MHSRRQLQWITFTIGVKGFWGGAARRFLLPHGMATEKFLNNAHGPNNCHAKFEVIADFIFKKILEVSDFLDLYYVWQKPSNLSGMN